MKLIVPDYDAKNVIYDLQKIIVIYAKYGVQI